MGAQQLQGFILTFGNRLRALADAVIVGTETVARDDPQLTTRLVSGANPTRVVIDPSLRAPIDGRIFHDGGPPTLIICAQGCATKVTHYGQAELVEVRSEGGVLPPAAIVSVLRRRGLSRLFVEGGGITISRFLAARMLDRLHVAIGPCLFGKGRPGLALPGVDRLDQVLRPRSRRFDMGEDVLFDCSLREYAPTVS